LKVRVQNGSVAVDAVLRAHVDRRLAFALGSIGDRVGDILVRLSHDAPTRAPALERCEIEVTLRPRNVRVAETGATLFLAVENAAHRLKRSVTRAVEREVAWPDGHPSPARPAPKRRK
jgi:ribosome-associated translation inhibitor RaiA